MKSPSRTLILAALILAGLLLVAPHVARADVAAQVGNTPTMDTACHNLDLVVLIDQSQSMRSNDTRGQRLEVAKLIVDQLGNHAIQLCPEQNIVHRLAVFGFGDLTRYLGSENNYIDDTREYLSPQILPNSYDYDNWLTTRDSMQDLIDNYRNENLSYTDHKSALLRARDVLKMWKEQPIAGAEDRRQAILLITDGEACTGSGGCSTDPTLYQFDRVGYMNDLINMALPSGADFPYIEGDPANSIYISMVALADNEESFNYRTEPTFRNGWTTIIGPRGQIYDTQVSNLDLATGMFDILRPLIGSNLQEWDCQSPISVVPYLDSSLIININRRPADPVIDPAGIAVYLDVDTGNQRQTLEGGEIVWADGTRHPLPATIRYTNDAGADNVIINESYVFTRPWPGVYNVRTEGGDVCKDVKVNYGKGSITAAIAHPAADTVLVQTPQEPYFNESAPDYLSLEVFDRGVLLQEIEGFPLLIRAEVTTPRDKQDMGQLELAGQGVYNSVNPIILRESGDYTWTTTGCVQSPTELVMLSAQGYTGDIIACPWAASGDNLLQVFQAGGDFAVFPVSFFTWRIADPIDGALLNMNTVQGNEQLPQPIPVTVELVGEGGEALASDVVFVEPRDAFRADLLKTGSDTALESIMLSPTSRGATEFAGQFANNNPAGPGEYRIVVRPNWEASAINRAEFAPQADFSQATAAHTQFEVFPLMARITPPDNPVLHRTTIPQCFTQIGDCFNKEIQPFDFTVELVNVKTNQVVPLAEALVDPNGPHSAVVAAPSGQEERVTLKPLASASVQQLQAVQVGQELTEPNEHIIELTLSDIALSDGFSWADTRQTATFTRQDTFMTNPLFTRGAVVLTGLILLALLIWFVYAHTGGPTGTLTYVAINSLDQTVNEGGSPWTLVSWKRTNKFKNNQLKAKGVAFIKVSRGSAIMNPNNRAINVESEDINGMPLFGGPMEEHDIQPFNDGQLRYGEQSVYGVN